MDMKEIKKCTAFAGETKIASGNLREVASRARAHLDANAQAAILIFDDETADLVEIDFRGTVEEVLSRLPEGSAPEVEKRPGPGRPKLGVESREISLLPRHWEWLNGQPGGASAAIRRLVEDARKQNAGKDRARHAQEAAHRFMWAMTGNLPGFEEVSRAFFAHDYTRVQTLIAPWPEDLRSHLWTMVERVAACEREANQEKPT